MKSSAMFTVNEIVGATLNIPLPLDKNSLLGSIAQTLHTKKFTATKTYVAEFNDLVDDTFSKLTFIGKGFAFGLLKTKISAQFLHGIEFVHPNLDMYDMKEDPSKILADEELKMASLDFNYILGLILGKMGLDDNNLEFVFDIHVSKEIDTTHSLNHLLVPESKTAFGKANDLKMTGIGIQMTESIMDIKVRSQYHINEFMNRDRDKNYYNVRAELEFKHSGPVDFSKIIKGSMGRLNDLTKSIASDGNEVKT